MILIDAMEKVPAGWLLIPIPDVCQINPPKPAQDALTPETPVTFVPMPAVDADSGTIATATVRPFVEVRKGFTAFRDRDVIMAKITPCMENGKAAIALNLENGFGFGSTEFHVFRSSPAILPEFVFHFIRQKSFRRAAADEMTGSVGQKRVPAEFLKRAEIPLPPLAEQKRIVAKVETLLARVNAARQRLAKVPSLLKRFRQSVLAAACSGQLTVDWRKHNGGQASATSFIKQLVNERNVDPPIFDGEDGLPEAWDRTTFGFLVEPTLRGKPFITSGSRGWAEYVADAGPYFIRSENINTEYLRLDEAIRVDPPEGAEADRTRVRPKDLLLTITGNNVGRTAVVPEDCPPAHVSQHVAIIRFDRRCNTNYLWLWLRSREHGQRQLTEGFYGETKPGLNLEQVRSVWVDLPPLGEQHEIVRRVEALLARADRIEKRLATATRRVETLTQAILAQAFRGELVPTEAELARQEGREYEPAAVLLERIRAASAGAATGKKSKRSRPTP